MSARDDAKKPTVKDVLFMFEQLSLSDKVCFLESLLDEMAANPHLDERAAAELSSKKQKQELVNVFIAQSLGIPAAL